MKKLLPSTYDTHSDYKAEVENVECRSYQKGISYDAPQHTCASNDGLSTAQSNKANL